MPFDTVDLWDGKILLHLGNKPESGDITSLIDTIESLGWRDLKA